MSNARICGKNAVDDDLCVLTCSVADIKPVESLQNTARGRILRVAAADGIEIKGTYGGVAVRATMMSIYRHNLESDATFRFQGYSDDAWTTEVIDTGTRAAVPTATLDYLDFGVEPLGISLFSPNYKLKRTPVWFDDAEMVKFDDEIILSWKLTVNDSTNTSGFIDISRLWIGKHFELDENPVYGGVMGLVDESQSYRTDGGGLHNDAVIQYRSGKFDMQILPEADRAMWASLSAYCGAGRRPFYFSLFPDNDVPALTMAHDGEFVFKAPLPQLAHVDAEGGRFNTSINLEET